MADHSLNRTRHASVTGMMHNCGTLSALLFLVVTVPGIATAQSFEVAAIKPHPPGEPCGESATPPGGRVILNCWPLMQMIREAYDVLPSQVSGGEPWVKSQPWDIVAKAEGFAGEIPVEQWRLMLRTLLKEQFHLTLQVDERVGPVFALLKAEVKKKGKQNAKPAPNLKPNTGAPFQFNLERGPSLTCTGITMQQFAAWLKSYVPGLRPVLDKTGLTGKYDFTLQWMPQPDSGGPSLFTALQEQLGLRLESQNGPVQSLVVTHAEAPAAN